MDAQQNYAAYTSSLTASGTYPAGKYLRGPLSHGHRNCCFCK